MASRVERTDAVGGNLIVEQRDERPAGAPATGSGAVVLPPAQLITQADPNLGLILLPSSGGRRINPTVAERARDQRIYGVLNGLVAEPLNGIRSAGGTGPTADTVRRYFFERRDAVANGFMRDHKFTREQAEAAADQWVARNVARWQYQRREHRGDGLRALTAAGMLIAIANAGGEVPPHLLEAARATQARVRQSLIEASMTPDADPDEVAAQVDAYLRNMGSRVNTTTFGWSEGVRALREADYYRSYNPPAQTQQGEVAPFNPPHYTRTQRAEASPLSEHAHSEAMRRADRVASAEHAVRVGQRKQDDMRAHLANLEAAGRPVGGPTFG
ncbi:MAG TPA: hypothetical protein VLC93_20465 [Myxococcota bacterium]|nr:hypothetical protein [Myxococcota bacterium]